MAIKLKTLEEFLNEANSYKKGSFGYWWTVIKGNEDISNTKYIGDIDCSGEGLTTLEGAPKEIIGDFFGYDNNLTTLEKGPKKVSGDIYFNNNKLTNLKSCPIGEGSIDYDSNKITTLKGMQKFVNGYFSCSNNNLTDLDGAPKEINGNFDCNSNKLTTLKKGPEKVSGSYNCNNNNLTNLEGISKEIGSYFSCTKNKKKFSKDTIKKMSKIKGTIINEQIEGINNDIIGLVIPHTIALIAQSHIWHLGCPSGQKHVALKELYEELQSEVDGLAEKFIAQGGVIKDYKYSLKSSYSDMEVYVELDKYRDLITGTIAANDTPEMKSIVDSLIDLQEVIDSKLYKFKLN